MSTGNSEKKYTIFTYNIGGYEVLHEVTNPSDICEYIYVTDDKTITSSTWNVVYIENNGQGDNFDLCYRLRYLEIFKYCKTDVVVRIDGSVSIVGDTDKLYYDFISGNYDIALNVHAFRDNVYDEFRAWELIKGYPKEQSDRVIGFMEHLGYDTQNTKGLYGFNVMIIKKEKRIEDFNYLTYALIRMFSFGERVVDNNDQCIGCFLLNKYFKDVFLNPKNNKRPGFSMELARNKHTTISKS